NPFWSGPFSRPGRERTVQQPQSCFAMITARGAELIEDAPLVQTPSALIAPVDAGQRLPFGK
ncbi:MAG TPA: hypothetical protein VF773_01375, partial [Verrucomicrobiae bacterium]